VIAASDALVPSAVITRRRASTETPSARVINVAGDGCASHATDSGPIAISGSTGATTTRSCAMGARASLAHPALAAATPATTAATSHPQPLRPPPRTNIALIGVLGPSSARARRTIAGPPRGIGPFATGS
jgi:hypothetical protein